MKYNNVERRRWILKRIENVLTATKYIIRHPLNNHIRCVEIWVITNENMCLYFLQVTAQSARTRITDIHYLLRQWPTWCTLALFYNTFVINPLMFRTLYAQHQEVELYWCSIWYRPLTCAPNGHWLRGRYQMLHQYNSTSWSWAYNARNIRGFIINVL